MKFLKKYNSFTWMNNELFRNKTFSTLNEIIIIE